VSAFDKRLTPARPDLAASHLRGKIAAERYADGITMQVIDVSAPLRGAPTPEASLDTEALHGERVVVYEQTEEGWSWGQLARDGYVGWLPSNALAQETDKPTHRVSALRTFVFPKPDIKSPPLASLSFGSEMAVMREEAEFVVARAGGFIPRQHVAETAFRESDAVAVAKRFLGTPYLWGDMQQKIGTAIAFAGGESALRRGDLIFWRGHVGFYTGAGVLLHANAHHMAVAEEPLAEAVARISRSGSELIAVRRP
jgi:cell wall-associated NlpC family hydrolase